MANRIEILMSIRDKWWEKEISTDPNIMKQIEVRTTKPIKKDIEYPVKVFVYVPEKKAVDGFLMVDYITEDFPNTEYEKSTRLSLQEQETYADGKQLCLWHIVKAHQYATPIPLDNFGMTRPPQSWQYISSDKKENQKKECQAYLGYGFLQGLDYFMGSVIIMDSKGQEHHFHLMNENKKVESPENRSDRNYSSTMLAIATFAINKAKELGCTSLNIHCNYNGIYCLNAGIWKPTSISAEQFLEAVKDSQMKIHVEQDITPEAKELINAADKIAMEEVKSYVKDMQIACQWQKCNIQSDKEITVSARKVIDNNIIKMEDEQTYIKINNVIYPAKKDDYIVRYMIAGCYSYGIMKENDFKRAFKIKE